MLWKLFVTEKKKKYRRYSSIIRIPVFIKIVPAFKINSHFFDSFTRRRSEEEDIAMPSQGRLVDVSKLSEDECSQILNVISKDILLRKSEKDRVA